MECIYPVLDVEQLLNVTSVDPSSDGSITFFERMASGKKAQASSKEDSLQTCQIKNQIKHHCWCLRNLINRQPPTKCIKIKKHGRGNSGKNDKPKLAFFPPFQHLQNANAGSCWWQQYAVSFLFNSQIAYFLLDIFGNTVSSLYIEVVCTLTCKNFANNCPMKIANALPVFSNAKCGFDPQFHPKWLWQYHPSRESPRGLMTGLCTWHNNFWFLKICGFLLRLSYLGFIQKVISRSKKSFQHPQHLWSSRKSVFSSSNASAAS